MKASIGLSIITPLFFYFFFAHRTGVVSGPIFKRKLLMKNNNGSVSIEASLVLPLFVFVMLFFIYIGNIYTVKAAVYEGCIETTEYMAEYAYLTDSFETAEIMDTAMAQVRFLEYVDSKALLDKYIIGGTMGVSFIGSSFPDDDGYINLKATYFVRINIPFFRNFRTKCTENIKQRAYLGRSDEETDEEKSSEDETYVYVTENGTVYHNSRNCTYLKPDIHISTVSSASTSGYSKCKYCGGSDEGSGGTVYITTYGDAYHFRKNCSRLKRTVERKKKSQVHLPPCSKCAGVH